MVKIKLEELREMGYGPGDVNSDLPIERMVEFNFPTGQLVEYMANDHGKKFSSIGYFHGLWTSESKPPYICVVGRYVEGNPADIRNISLPDIQEIHFSTPKLKHFSTLRSK